MQKLFDHFKTNAGVWTFGLFMTAVAGGIYQFTVFMVSAQVTPVRARVNAEVKRLDAADGNTNIRIADFKEHMDERFDELKRGIGLNREKIDLLNEQIDTKITRLNEKIDRKISLLDQKIEKKIDLLDQKISRLDEKMDKKFDLILLRLPPLKK